MGNYKRRGFEISGSQDSNLLKRILNELAKVIKPLSDAVGNIGQDQGQALIQLAAQFGYNLKPADATSISAPLGTISNPLNSTNQSTPLSQILTDLGTNIDDPDKILEVMGAIRNIMTVINSLNTLGGSLAKFGDDLLSYLLVSYLETNYPIIYGILTLLDIVEESDIATATPPYTKRTINWNYFLLIFNPSQLFSTAYGWNTSNFNSPKMLSSIQKAGRSFGIPAFYKTDPGSTASYLFIGLDLGDTSQIGAKVLPLSASSATATDAGLAVVPLGTINLNKSVDLGNGWSLSPNINASLQVDYGLLIRPNSVSFGLLPGSTDAITASIDADINLNKKNQNGKIIFFGKSDGIRLQADSIRISAGIHSSSGEVQLKTTFDGLQLVISTSDADGFLKDILGDTEQTVDFSSSIIWSSKTGLHFEGNAGLEMTFPINKTISIVQLDTLSVGLKIGDTADLVVAVTGAVTLGPLTVIVDKIGIKLSLAQATSGQPQGILGGLDLKFGFKPPDGIGLAIDSSFAKGGGYLFFDNEKQEYAGILQLDVKGIAVKGIGILNTKLPDGKPGFSLLIIISAEFQPIQLGYGFTLNGVGGLLGLNRTVIVEVLREGIRNRTLDSILFPKDPIRDAPKIISDLKSVFPPAEGHFVFGPMAKIGWGTPTLITGDVGVAVELPDPIRIILLGKIRAALPTEKQALVRINTDVLGILDFEKNTLSIDASIYDSKLLQYDLTGDMALRASWGAEPLFILSIGGFNPRFQPPPGFPSLSRLQVSLGVGNNPRLNLQAYLALTSNTAQFGALLELYAEASGFNISGHLGFDTLFQFSPFEFIGDISGGVAFRQGDTTLAAVNLDGTLSGPRPWHARGTASISLFLFLEASVSFDEKWGEEAPVVLPAIDVWEGFKDTEEILGLKSTLKDTRNWSALLPSGSSRMVSYRNTGETSGKVVVDPFGTLVVRQKVAPLDHKLTRFGNAVPAGDTYFKINNVTVGGISLPFSREDDFFAPAQFDDMSVDEKLSLPSFVKMQSGVNIGYGAVSSDKPVEADLEYETRVIDLKGKRQVLKAKHKPNRSAMLAMSEIGPLSTSMLLNSGENKYAWHIEEPAVRMEDDLYAVANTSNMKANTNVMLGKSGGMTQSEAYTTMKYYVQNHPEEKGNLQVVSVQEVA